jgi:Fe-S oxidoreductase
MEQSCCGLPVLSMGERKAAQSVAEQNVRAFADGGYDYIVTLCASCASHIKNNYVQCLSGQPELAADTARFVERIRDFSSFTRDVLQLGAQDLVKSGETVTYHAPCHLCRGLGIQEQPRALLADAAEYKPSAEEEVCCGFGGTYSVKFPEVSAQLLEMKLNNAEVSGASTLVTDCPGCVMQLRGGEEKRGKKLKVQHMAEFLSDKLKK